jgi:hypothetical protein
MRQPDNVRRGRPREFQRVFPGHLSAAPRVMAEEDARLALLQAELAAIQTAIRGLDDTDFQIKGWCVTASLAIGGFAAAYHKPALLIVAFGAVAGFYFMNCQFKGIQRVFIMRNLEIDNELKSIGIMAVLKGQGNLEIVGTAAPQWTKSSDRTWRGQARHQLAKVLHEGILPNVFSLYLFIFVCLIVELVILG